METYFIGNTCFPTKIVYLNKIDLYYAGIKKDYRLARLEPGDTIFKKYVPQHLISHMFS